MRWLLFAAAVAVVVLPGCATADRAAHRVGGAVERVGDGVGSVGGRVVRKVGGVAEGVGNRVETVGHRVGSRTRGFFARLFGSDDGYDNRRSRRTARMERRANTGQRTSSRYETVSPRYVGTDS